ncbi:imidazole glycerol phosphate synthase subunit HisH [Spongorhabdus nitratireducens]
METVAVIDYGMGNLHSVAKALEHSAPANTRIVVTPDPDVVRHADRVLLPGVGAIRDCMAEVKRLGVDELVKEVVQHRPLMGICVGMQLLLEHSEENDGVDCIGLLPGKVKFFGKELQDSNGERLKVPHMGWSQVHQHPHQLWQDIPQDSRFYFVHSYHVHSDEQLVAGECEYGVGFHAALARDNIFTTQFHPEKSATVGLQLLANFLRWKP